jgi:hypothetical protein
LVIPHSFGTTPLATTVPVGKPLPAQPTVSDGPQAGPIEKIEQELGLKWPDQLMRSQIVKIILESAIRRKTFPPKSSMAVGRRLSEIRKNIGRDYEIRDGTRRALLSLLLLAPQMAAYIDDAAKVEAFIKTLKVGGRPRDPRREMIGRLVPLYENIAGKRASVSWDASKEKFVGPFFRLVELAETTAAAVSKTPRASNKALGMLVRRIAR